MGQFVDLLMVVERLVHIVALYSVFVNSNHVHFEPELGGTDVYCVFQGDPHYILEDIVLFLI